MKLAQISAIAPPNDASYMAQNTRMVVDIMIQTHPLIQFLEFYPHTGNADTPRSRGVSTGGQYRAVGTDFTATAVTPQYGSTSLKIFGDAFTVDQAHIRRGIDIEGYIMGELRVYAEEGTYNFVEQIVHGAGSGNAWTGIAGRCVSGQRVYMATNGAALPLGNSDTNRTAQQVFFEKLDQAIAKTRGGNRFIIMNSTLHSRVTSVYREAFRWVAGVGEQVPFYNGIPVVPAGYDADGNEILPFSETRGTSNITSSVYVVAPGEKTKFTIASNTGINVYMSTIGQKREVTVEGDFDPITLDSKCIAAVSGVLL